MNSKQKQTAALVLEAWHALPHLSGAGWGDGKQKLFEIGAADEKGHRKFAPDGYRHSTSVADATRLLAVYDIARALKANDKPAGWKDFLSLRVSYITAAALAEINREVILKAWEQSSIGLEALAALDYSDFVGGE